MTPLPDGAEILAQFADLPDGEAVAFPGPEPYTGWIVLRRGERLDAYINSCPHLRVPLDWQPGKFMDWDKLHLLCTTHGALFRFDDGYCVAGPCVGASLRRAPIERIGDQVVLIK